VKIAKAVKAIKKSKRRRREERLLPLRKEPTFEFGETSGVLAMPSSFRYTVHYGKWNEELVTSDNGGSALCRGAHAGRPGVRGIQALEALTAMEGVVSPPP